MPVRPAGRDWWARGDRPAQVVGLREVERGREKIFMKVGHIMGCQGFYREGARRRTEFGAADSIRDL